MAKCAGIKRDGGRCTVVVNGSQTYCYQHDPSKADERRRAASKAGKSKPNREIQTIKARLEDLADGVLLGTTDRGNASIVAQIWNTYLRALTVELKAREQLELEERLTELEDLLNDKKEQSRW